MEVLALTELGSLNACVLQDLMESAVSWMSVSIHIHILKFLVHSTILMSVSVHTQILEQQI